MTVYTLPVIVTGKSGALFYGRKDLFLTTRRKILFHGGFYQFRGLKRTVPDQPGIAYLRRCCTLSLL